MVVMYVKAADLETPEARQALCESMQGKVRQAKKHFKTDFDQMLEDMEMAMTGRTRNWKKSCYTVNITQRFVRQKVAALYAKNPRAIAKRKHRMVYKMWDGDSQSIQMAQAQIQMAQEAKMPLPEEAMALMQDIQEGNAKSRMMDRVGESMEKLYRYYTDEQQPSFKAQMKKCVRSAVQTSVGYIKIGFQREMDLSPDNRAKIQDFATRLAHIERLQGDLENDENSVTPDSAEAEELKLAMAQMEQEKEIILREGLVFDFPSSTSIIPDPRCTCLTGWMGADWLTEELFMTPNEIKEFFNIDIGMEGNQTYNQYSTTGDEYNRNPRNDLADEQSNMACVWVFYHKPSGLKYTMVDGYRDFLEEPEAPDVTLERFFPVYALCYNQLEHSKKLFPPSDVRLMADQQMEMNRTRESMREHRMANRPGYATPRGSMSIEDKANLGSHPSNAVIEIDGLVPGQKVADMLQALPKIGVDPNLYDTSQLMNDVFLAVGANESTFGTTSGATATESSIAEANRTGALEAEIDELNDFLTDIARDAGQVMLAELSKETVRELIGQGAIWPDMSQENIQKEIYLDVVAGSNGRPNRAQRQQALQQLVPFLIQVPGVSPEWLAKLLIEAVDDSIDLSEAIAGNLPSIMTMNNQTQATGAEQDPNAQGGAGANNAAQPAEPSQGAGPQGNRDRQAMAAV